VHPRKDISCDVFGKVPRRQELLLSDVDMKWLALLAGRHFEKRRAARDQIAIAALTAKSDRAQRCLDILHKLDGCCWPEATKYSARPLVS